MALPTKDDIIFNATEEYLSSLDRSQLPDLGNLKAELLEKTREMIDFQNAVLPKSQMIKIPNCLSPYQIAMVIQTVEHVRYIQCDGKSGSRSGILGIYQATDENTGLYDTSDKTIRRIIRQYNRELTTRQIDDIVEILKENAPRAVRCQNRDLIAVNNGLFDYKNKTLLPFTPDKVYLTKCRIDYVPAPMLPVIHNDIDGTDWDVESWISELSDDSEIVQLLWEILGAIIRPYVSWDKSAWFYSTSGSNGKGSLCALMRNLCGPGSCANIPLSDFSQEFKLEPLTRATAIIVDENDVGGYIDRAANLKAIVTHDVISINIKFHDPIDYQFFGFMVQCLNEFPRIKDKSDSFYRRQLFVPFNKCFTGQERKYIKSDYLTRPDVLQYVLHKVLHMDYYELSEPAACKEALAEYKDFNDPVRQFAEEMLPLCKWDLLPFGFLYDLYKSWFKRNSPSGSVQGRNTFINGLLSVLPSFPDWTCEGKNKQTRSANRMGWSEPLIAEYDLTDWMNPAYNGVDIDKRCRPLLKDKYTGGLLRVSAPQVANDDDT